MEAGTAQANVPPRLKERYEQEIRARLKERFGYSSVDAGAAPRRRSR